MEQPMSTHGSRGFPGLLHHPKDSPGRPTREGQMTGEVAALGPLELALPKCPSEATLGFGPRSRPQTHLPTLEAQQRG